MSAATVMGPLSKRLPTHQQIHVNTTDPAMSVATVNAPLSTRLLTHLLYHITATDPAMPLKASPQALKEKQFCGSALEEVLAVTPCDGDCAECGDTAACDGDLGWRIRTGHSLRDPLQRVCAPRCAKHDDSSSHS